MYSLYPLHLEGNQGPTFVSMDPNTAYVCAIPCEGDCDCNDRPVLSFNISSSSSSSENQTLVFASSQSSFVLPLTLGTPSPFDFQLPLRIELSNGLLYDEHLVFAPPPTPPPTGPVATTLNVTVDILQNQTEVPFIITRLPTLQEEGTITIRVTPELFNSSSYASFFLPVDYMLMVKVQPAALSFDAANRTFRSSHASIAVSFPNANKPDYTISLFNESRPLANSSVSAEFISLMEINEERRSGEHCLSTGNQLRTRRIGQHHLQLEQRSSLHLFLRSHLLSHHQRRRQEHEEAGKLNRSH